MGRNGLREKHQQGKKKKRKDPPAQGPSAKLNGLLSIKGGNSPTGTRKQIQKKKKAKKVSVEREYAFKEEGLRMNRGGTGVLTGQEGDQGAIERFQAKGLSGKV